MNDPKVFKIGVGKVKSWDLSAMVFRSKSQRSKSQGHKVQNTLKAIEWPA